VWTALGPDYYLVAVIEPSTQECDAFWARASDLPAPQIFSRRELAPEEHDAVLRALRRRPAERETRAEYDAFVESTGGALPSFADAIPPRAPASWWDLDAYWHAAAFAHPATGATYVTAERLADLGCADFRGYAFGIFRMASPQWVDLTGEPDPSHILPGRPLAGVAPEAAVLLEPGGLPILIGRQMLYAQSARGFVPVMGIGRTRSTCSC
jgi:hypothetical protein